MSLSLKRISSLEKVFPLETPKPFDGPLSVLQDDQVSFQIGILADKMEDRFFRAEASVQVSSSLGGCITIRKVESVPVRLAAYDISDGGYISDQPGLYPDLLTPLREGTVVDIIRGQWSALWVEVTTSSETPAGEYPIRIAVTVGHETASLETTVTVVGQVLPQQILKHTGWFHCDGIAHYYQEPVWTERYWELLRAQIRTAVKRGINMILTPIWTPPLDTRVGHERLTTQLVDITVCAEINGYKFDFTRFDRFVHLCLEEGIRYFEMAHLFTQWGAKHCPKIVATVDGKEQRIFGWDTDATGASYADFLKAFLPALTAHLQDLNIADRVYFHISDEPSSEALPQYQACRKLAEPLLTGFPIMDAMSDYSYFEQGICQIPVVATNHLTPFLTNRRPEEFWVYYCCGQWDKVANRFMAMPSSRNRILGVQLYKFAVQGFLQWGFNFYNSVTSIRPIDPFAVTDADGAFPAGDPFVVYPGPNGQPLESLRLVVFSDALHDLRALQLLESLTSREHVLALIEEGLAEPLSFTEYPLAPAYLLHLREKVNREIEKLL